MRALEVAKMPRQDTTYVLTAMGNVRVTRYETHTKMWFEACARVPGSRECVFAGTPEVPISRRDRSPPKQLLADIEEQLRRAKFAVYRNPLFDS